MSSPETPHITIHSSLAATPPWVTAWYAKENQNTGQTYALHAGDHARHIQRSHAEIQTTAFAATERAPRKRPITAIILGAGACIDIPYKYLAEMFDHTTFVDVNPASTAKALSTLPPELLGKVSTVGADVSGVLAPLATNIEAIDSNEPDDALFAGAIVDAITDIAPENAQPDLGEGYSFVCSQLLLSRLATSAITLMNRRHDTELAYSIEPTDDPLYGPLLNLSQRLQTSHLAYLRRLVAPQGTVHLADTYESITGTYPKMKRTPRLDRDMLDRLVVTDFTSLRPDENWLYKVVPGISTFNVVAKSLAPLPEDASARLLEHN